MERRKINSILEVIKVSWNRFYVEIKGVEDVFFWKLIWVGFFGWMVEFFLNGIIWFVNIMIFFFVLIVFEFIIDVYNGVSYCKWN